MIMHVVLCMGLNELKAERLPHVVGLFSLAEKGQFQLAYNYKVSNPFLALVMRFPDYI